MLMTMNTVRLALVSGTAMSDFLNHLSMALNAVVLQNGSVLAVNANRLVEVLQGKPLGVPEAVLCLGEILANKVVGQMAIHATGYSMMTGLLPAIVLLAHDMAVHAGFGVAAEITQPFAVIDGVRTRPCANADQCPDEDTCYASTNQPLKVFHAHNHWKGCQFISDIHVQYNGNRTIHYKP
jgi:hypothetical protein